jgi:pSer/pThr/pTyr-binding forkhead associated (FHA) protein
MKFCRSCGASLSLQAMPMQAVPMQAVPMQAMPAPMAVSAPLAFDSGRTPRPEVRAPIASTINCPRCGTATPLGFAYCQQCGLHMQGVAPTDPGAAGSRARPASRPPPVGQLGIDVQAATVAQPDARAARPYELPPPPAAPHPAVSVWATAVLVNRDGSDGQRFPLTSVDTIVGRGGADISFDDDRFLARQHARIERASDGTVRIHPIDGVNGVFKKADSAVELADGTTILVGREVLRFERVAADERTVHPLIRHGVALFGSPPRDPWGRLFQMIPSGGYRDVRHLVGNEVVLGREEGDIVFRDDAFMSRRHAALMWDGKRAVLTDLGSSNGTFVRLLVPTALKYGDHVRVGDQLLRIER